MYKVFIQTNNNGKKQTTNKSFKSYSDYEDFISKNPDISWMIEDANRSFSDFWSYMDSYFDQRLSSFFWDNLSIWIWSNFLNSWKKLLDQNALDTKEVQGIDFWKYEQVVKDLENKYQEKEQKKSTLQSWIDKLKWFIETFKKAWDKDNQKSAQNDLKKLEERMKEFD